ncbi:MAG TPA: DUF669 domain-containing protein [Miltoncostaeaceae bacterium]|nr:DUF669 domain-containing protein [Miltoncostaeaceae bacterium]
MAIPVNFDGIEAKAGGGMVPPGEYRVRVEHAEETTASTGTPGIELQLRVVGGPEDGGLLFDTIWITPRAMPFVRHRLECMGVKIPAGQWSLTPQPLLGRVARVVVRHETYTSREGEQKVRPRVAGWEKPAADWPPAAPFEEPTQAPTGGAGGDDDIPF